MCFPPPLIAFGIVHLPMLGWLAAAALPILIQLWSRRRYREVPWAAMQYLLAALRKRQRRLRLQQWLLVAVRTLIIVLVVLAVAEPYLERSVLALAAGHRTHHVLVVDGSYSMGYKPAGQDRFQQAKRIAAQIVEGSPQGDGFTLVLMAAPPRVAVGTPSFDGVALSHEIDNLRMAPTTADLPATLGAVDQVVQAAQRGYPRFTRHEVIFLTDLGRVGWVPAGASAAAECRRRAELLAASASLVVIDLGQPSPENMAITGLRASPAAATVAQNIRFQAEVKTFGAAPQRQRAVEWWIDGRRIQQQRVDLSPGGATSLSFAYRFETPGDHAVEARLDADRLELDNHRWLVLPVREFLRVLCVDGRPARGPVGGAAAYLVSALSAKSGAGDRAAIRPEVAPESALLDRDLTKYDAVFLCNVAQFTPSEAKVLDAYLGSGGNLIFFLGDRVLPDVYNRELTGRGTAPRVLPARLGDVAAEPQFRLDPLTYRHPAIQAFRDRPRAGLLTTPVSKYFKLELPKDSKARVVVALGNGDPLMVEEPIRRGRVVLVATSADISWTAMPLWPSFLPLVHELLGYCIAGEFQQQNLEVGQSLGGAVPAAAAEVAVAVVRPDGSSEPVRAHAEGDFSRWSFEDTWAGGIYTARIGPPVSRSRLFAVNVDTAESDLTPLGLDALRRDIWPQIPFHYQTTWQNPQQPAVAGLGHRGHLHLGLLYAALGLVFLETFSAWRLGHHEA